MGREQRAGQLAEAGSSAAGQACAGIGLDGLLPMNLWSATDPPLYAMSFSIFHHLTVF